MPSYPIIETSIKIQKMLNRLNYYSRYNRIKCPKEIQTLYHLIQDLNLDAIVTDELISRVSYLRDTHHAEKQFMKKSMGEGHGNQEVQLDFVNLENGDNRKRNASEEKNSSQRSANMLRQQIIQYLKLNSSQQQDLPQIAPESVGNHTGRPLNQQQSIQMSGPKSSAYKNRNKTNNLSQLNCLQTKSIPESEKSIENTPQSPINRLQDPSLEGENDRIVTRSQFLETNQRNTGNMKSSHYGDQFSQGLDQLHKVDQVRNSSFYKQGQQARRETQSVDQECRSEKLYRFYGFDLDVVEGTELDSLIKEHENGNKFMQGLQIFIKQQDGHLKEVIIQQQPKENPQVPLLPAAEVILYQPQPNIQQSGHYFDSKDYEHEDEEESDYITEQVERKPQQTSIDHQMQKKSEFHINDEISTKIPNNGFTQGKWPISVTQKSIEAIIEQDISPYPSTLVQNSGCAEKERKPFKKMMMDKKLNPRMVTSTFVNEVPVKKVNFKKMIKKQSAENRAIKQKTPQKKKTKEVKPAEQKKQLLKAFFDQN